MEKRTTHVWKVDPEQPDPSVMERAAEIIRGGGLVAFPTETVYGLGADGLNPTAVARIYAAKGRPARNPIILHVADVEDALPLVTNWPATASLLAERFWPGPLTLVLPRSQRVPAAVSANGPTVAIRCPTHPVALALIRAARVPIAAPSANRSSELSPTLPQHVLSGLVGRIDALLDGGPTSAGIESTVIDLSGDVPRLLRPGPIPPSQIEAIIGFLVRQTNIQADETLRSPGMLARHYAPRTPLECLATREQVVERSAELTQAGKRIGVVTFVSEKSADGRGEWIVMPRDPARYAADLYRVLHELDGQSLDLILVQLPPAVDKWLAVRDRLLRAATPG